MVLRFLSRTPLRHLVPRDTPPAGSLPATSQSSHGGSGNGARTGVARTKTKEAEDILADLEKQGLEIDDKIASILDDEVARIKAEASRENIKIDWGGGTGHSYMYWCWFTDRREIV